MNIDEFINENEISGSKAEEDEIDVDDFLVSPEKLTNNKPVAIKDPVLGVSPSLESLLTSVTPTANKIQLPHQAKGTAI